MSINPEDLLWKLAGLKEEDGKTTVADSGLQDYRKGRLAPHEAEQVERILARSSEARKRLAELSGLTPNAPSQQLRSRVLASLPARRPRRLSWQKAALAAAAMVLVGSMVQLFRITDPGSSPAFVPEYEIQVFAEADMRSPERTSPSGDTPGRHRVRSDTRLRIEFSARKSSTQEVDYGLYRLEGNRLQRLAQGVFVEPFRGAARLEALGSVLAPQPGHWQLYALVAAQGKLPPSLALQSGDSPQARLSEASGGRVFPLQLELLPDGTMED